MWKTFFEKVSRYGEFEFDPNDAPEPFSCAPFRRELKDSRRLPSLSQAAMAEAEMKSIASIRLQEKYNCVRAYESIGAPMEE